MAGARRERESSVHGVDPPAGELHAVLALHQAGAHKEFQQSARALLARFPGTGLVWLLLGVSLHQQGMDSLEALRTAVALMPDAAAAHANLGTVQRAHGMLDEAIASFRRALELEPDSDDAHCNLGSALQMAGRIDEAIALFQRCLEINPRHVAAQNNMGHAFQTLGKAEAAEQCYLEALETKPTFAECYSNLLFLYAFHASLSPQRYLERARGWEIACLPEAERRAAKARAFHRLPLAGRRLRIGYVSAHFRRHPVSDNIRLLFTCHDRARVEVFAYSNSLQQDAVTDAIRSSVEHWVPVCGVSDAALQDRILADRIDVLVDLSGHIEGGRLGVFARRAAPVQVYYLGYFASTGLSEMDYLIGDQALTPPDADGHYSEKVWRLPRAWQCYNQENDAPPADWRPAPDGSVVLGSFNNLNKLNAPTFELWAAVLKALPEAKLLLKTKELAHPPNRQRVSEAISAHGIAPGRLELYDSGASPSWRDHMNFYNRVDIALDPVEGMSGGITTCDALWMGVPVVAMMGDRMSSRISASLLEAVGRSEWIARTPGEYVAKTVDLARDVARRAGWRALQRDQIRKSALGDARGLAVALEQAYREMFERWMQGRSRSEDIRGAVTETAATGR